MAKVSIGLRGWRFEESEVFAPDGGMRPINEMPPDARERVLRLSALVGSPCDACRLIHGEERLGRCHPAEVVYGEPHAEVVLCGVHEPDFLYWYREEGGDAHRGTDEFGAAFESWFDDGGAAPEGYGGIEHVETDPENLPDPEQLDAASGGSCTTCGPDVGEGVPDVDGENASDSAGTADDDGAKDDEPDLDLGVDYPTG